MERCWQTGQQELGSAGSTAAGSMLEVAAAIATAGKGPSLRASGHSEGQLARSIAAEAAGTDRTRAEVGITAARTGCIEAAADTALATDRITIAFLF